MESRYATAGQISNVGLAASMLWISLGSPLPLPGPPMPAFAHRRGLRLDLYDVTGNTVAEIQRSMKLHPIRDADLGKRMYVRTEVWMTWDAARQVGPVGCTLHDARVKLEFEIYWPRLVRSQPSREASERWQRYLAGAERYVTENIRLADARADRVRIALEGVSCVAGDAAANAIWAGISDDFREFAFRTCYGVTMGSYFWFDRNGNTLPCPPWLQRLIDSRAGASGG
jgi:predicted secreted Zn-dependent protease